MVPEKRRIDGNPGAVFPKTATQDRFKRYQMVQMGKKIPVYKADEIDGVIIFQMGIDKLIEEIGGVVNRFSNPPNIFF